MADAFAPQFGGEVRFNQPIETPSALGALANIGETFVGAFMAAQSNRASAAPKVDPNLAVFRTGLERVEAIRQERGETAALVAERQLASNFAMAGISFDANYEDVYKTTTGRPWTGYGMDVQATMLQDVVKDPQVQASYVASFAVLGPEATNDQRLEYAIGQKATLQAIENEITRSKAEANYQWSVNTEAAYSTAIDTFLNTSLGGLAANTQQGGRVSPMDVTNLKAQWDQLKITLSRPSNVEDGQWKAIQDKISNIDNLFTTFDKAASSDLLFEELSTGFASALIAGGNGSKESYIAGMTALKDPATLTNLMGGKVETFIMDVGNGTLNLDITQQDLFGHILQDQASLVGVEDPNAFVSTIPDNIKTAIDGKTPEQIYRGLEASGKLTSIVGPVDLNRTDAKEQFVTNAATIGAVLMNNPSDQFLSDAALKKLIANPQFIRNIIALDAIDPEAATVSRSYVRSGLNTELARQQRNLSAIESSLGVVWNGSAYVLDKKALISNGMSEEQANGFIAWVGRTYGGDTRAMADGLVPMPAGMNFNPVGLQQAYDRRAAIGTINGAITALAVPTDQTAAGAAPASGLGAVTAETPATYFDVNDQNLPSGGAIVEVGSARVAANSVMQPLLNTTAGASRMLKEGADTRMAGLLQGPFQALQSAFGKPLVINDGLAKDGTSRESETPNSRHFHGDALDISTAGMTDAEKLKLVDDAIAAGFQGFGFGNNILHIDLGAKRAWAYGNETFGGVPVSELKARVQGSTVAPAAVRMDPRVSQPSAGGVLTTPEVDDREGAPTGFTVFSGVAPVAPAGAAEATAPATDAGTAALPEAITPSQPMPQITEQGVQNTPVIDREVRAFISEIAANPDRSYTTDAEFLAAQQRGELEPGDTVVVDGVAYVIRKDGTARRLGQIEQQQQ